MGERNYRNSGQNRRTSSSKPKSGNGRGIMVGVLIGLVVGISVAVGLAMYLNRSSTPFTNLDKFADRNAQTTSGSIEELAPGTQIVDASQAPSQNLPPLTEINARAEAQAQAQASAAGQESAQATGQDEPEFDFYKILPGQADAVPGGDTAARPRETNVNKSTYLQLGSFQNEKEADNLKARLALLGVEAKIQSVEVQDKGLVHRVRIGPFSSKDDMDRMKSQLQQNGIDAAPTR